MNEQSGHSHDLSLPVDEIPAVGELVAGKYRIEGRLGAGGMGVVLAARHEAIGQRVAIKFLVIADEHFRAEAIQRLLREARAAAALRGEHVVRVYDIGELPSGAPFIVMEHLEGKDLAAVVQAVGRLAVSDAVALVSQAASALSEAHQLGIVHRDLKPSNLFLVRRPDGAAAIKVLDFGIAKSADPVQPQTLTGARVVLGTAHYMSPEQIRDSHTVDARSDVWSLGAILYELVAGRPAFQASTHSGVYAAIVADTPTPLSSLRPDVPLALQQILSQCLERDQARRVQSAAALADFLAPFAGRNVDYDRLFERSLPAPVLADYALALAPGGTSISPTLPAPGAAVLEAAPPAAPPDTQVSFGASSSTPEPMAERRSHAASGFQRTKRSLSANAPAPRALQRRALVALGVLVALALPAWLLTRGSGREAAVIDVTPSLTIASKPAGARVREGDRALGVTPLRVPLAAPSAGFTEPRRFTLELPGYRPRVIEQGPARGNVQLHAELEPVPAPPPTASSVQESVLPPEPPRAAVRPAPARAGSLQVPPRPSAEVGDSPEIRLNR